MQLVSYRTGWRLRAPMTTLATLAVLAIPLSAPADADDSEGTAAPPHTVSRYVPLTGADADLDRAWDWGCADGESGRSGLRILFLGTQESGARLRQPGTSGGSPTPRVPVRTTVEVARHWTEGFTACRADDATAVLALGVNNKDDGGVGGAAAGREWAAVVADAEAVVAEALGEPGAAPDGADRERPAEEAADEDEVEQPDRAAAPGEEPMVRVAGAVDAEPGWSSPRWARDWVDAFTAASDLTLYAANSADGCPSDRSGATRCNNGWTVSDVHYVATGADPALRAVPQIYRTDGIQARQWAHVSAWGARTGAGPVSFAGALSQARACEQRGCSGTNNPPKDAWRQLWEELGREPGTRIAELPHVTDMRWP